MLLAQMAGAGGNVKSITFSADVDNVNLKTAVEALYGAIATAVTVIATINAGVKIGGTTNTYSFRTGGFPAGSTVKIINYGSIYGRGGHGGDGAQPGGSLIGEPGESGFDAMSLDDNITIDNTTTGQIFGGGRGGKGGNTHDDTEYGGGGGGGQGHDGGAGGFGPGPATGGDSGDYLAPGGGGNGANGGNDGNNGGTWGWGKAIEKNGKTVTWIAGNNATQVKGAVS